MLNDRGGDDTSGSDETVGSISRVKYGAVRWVPSYAPPDTARHGTRGGR